MLFRYSLLQTPRHFMDDYVTVLEPSLSIPPSTVTSIFMALQMLYFLLLSFIPRLDSSQFYHLVGDRGRVITSEWQMISRSRH